MKNILHSVIVLFAAFFCLLFLTQGSVVSAQGPIPILSNGTKGAFGVAGTWVGSIVPGLNDTAVIVSGDTVSLDAIATIGGLRIMPAAKLDNNNFQLSLTNSSGTLYYIVYGEHDITGNVVYTHGTGSENFKMTGTSSSPGGLISGSGELRLNVCVGDTISGFFDIPDANIVVGYTSSFCGSSYIIMSATMTMTNGNISINNTYAIKNYGSISMLNGSIFLMMNTTTSTIVLRNYGTLLLNTGSIVYSTYLTVLNEATGIITLQRGNIDMAESATTGGMFRNKGMVTLTEGYITEPVSGVKKQVFWNDNGSTLNIGGSGEPIFPGSPLGSAELYLYNINTVNYMGAGKQKIRKPIVVNSTGTPTSNRYYWHLTCSNDSAKSIDGYDLEIKGDLTLRDSALLDVSKDGGTNNYNMTITGNWYDSSKAMQPFLPRDKKVTFNGTSTQSITTTNKAGEEKFYDLVINNKSTGLNIVKGNINISDTLTLADGLITTGFDTVWVSNMDTAAIQSYSDSTYVNGYLKRSIYPNVDSSYNFPVGNANAYELANIDFNGSNTTDALTVNFSNLSGTSGLPLTDANDAIYNSLLNCGGLATGIGNANAGVWNIRPGIGSAIYDLTLYAHHHSNQQIYHSIVKRNNNIAPWEFAGTYLAASGTEPLIAHRTCLLDFYQFAIASSNTNAPLVTTPLSFFSPDNMICGSKCIDFTAKSILSATKWKWMIPGAVFSSGADTLQNPGNICFNSVGKYDVRLIASTACTADTLPLSQYIKVNPIPTITITGETSICSGKRTTLSDASLTSNLSYLWSTGSTGQGINVIPLTNTTYSVETSNGFCKDTTYIDVNVTTSPTVSITANTSAICSGENVFITSSAGSGVIADNYLWSNGESGNAITVSPTTTQTYSLTLSNGICAERGILTINVTTQPTAIITGETSICSGKRNVLSATSAVNGVTYLWNTGETGQSINASTNTSSTYSVVLSNGICKDTANLFISVTTTPSITLTSNKTIVCAGENLIIKGSGTGAYLWSTGASTNIINTTALSSQNFVLTLSNFNCLDKDSISITVIPMPTASIGGSSTVCSGNNTNLTASGGGGSTYLWNTGETTASITKTPLSNTIYSVSVSNGNGLCIDTASRSITLINPIPTDAGPNITIAIGLDTLLSTNNGTAWDWTPKGRLNCYSCQSTIVNPLQTTSYTVTVTDINGCKTIDSITVFVIPCADLFIPKAFSPNNDGENDLLYIRGTDCIEKVFSFSVFNRWGEKVFETTDIKTGWDGTYLSQTPTNNVFIYYLDALLINGETISKTGNVSLMK